MSKVTSFIKKEIVMLLSLVLAATSSFFVVPNKNYLNYIDFRTLSLLFVLMAITAGLNRIGIFKLLAEKILGMVNTVFGLTLTFVILCFFSSMLITNDVALITFVPFTIITLKIAGQKQKLIYTVILETVAANLGSMLTPVGNPQNLYLFSAYNMEPGRFFKITLPYCMLSLIMLIVAALFVGRESVSVKNTYKPEKINFRLTAMYIILFALALLSVFRILHCSVLLAATVALVLIFDRRSLADVDYSLLMTFVFLFIFIGNLSNITSISNFLHTIVYENEVITGIAASQIFSNVPATILLSGFTDNAEMLLIGVNLGGLGTIIASMASLISFKFIQNEKVKASRYLFLFSAVNIIFLAFNICLWMIIG